MRYLLDVNVLVAWGWWDHAEHERAARWVGGGLHDGATTFLTSTIPQLGFVRLSVHLAAGQLTVQQAGEALDGLLAALGDSHCFVADDLSALSWPDWCRGAGQTTDAHLLALAESHGVRLATLDSGIPGAFLVPTD